MLDNQCRPALLPAPLPKVPGRALNDTSLECTSPAVPREGSVAVSVALRYMNTKRKTEFVARDGASTRRGDLSSEGGGLLFQFYPTEVVSEIRPYEGPARGGTTVTITGTDFRDTPDLVVRFAYSETFESGDNTTVTEHSNSNNTATATVSARYITSKELTAEAPPCPLGPRASALFAVEVSSNGVDFPHNPNGPLYFYDASEPFVERLSPKIVRESAGVELTIRGFAFPETFPSTLACVFGGGDGEATVPATRHSMELLTCVCPSLPPGTVVVTVTSYGQAIASDGDLLVEYVSDLRIFLSSPTIGPARGGTAVTVLGQGFREEETYVCAFGSLLSPSAEATLLNTSAITCQSPIALGGGTVTLQVLTVQDDALLPSRSYVHRLASTGALTDVALTTAAATYGNESTASALLSFEYHDNVEITQLSPANGPASGGTAVRVSGSGFMDLPGAACRFGTGEPTPATVISSGTLVCTTSSLTAAAGLSRGPDKVFASSSRAQRGVEFRVAMNGIDFAPINTSVNFLYDDDMTVVALVPDRGPATGGLRVVVRGSGFRPDERLACRFGLQEVAAEYLRGDAIACLSPPQAHVSVVSVSVTLNGQDFSSGTQGAAPTTTSSTAVIDHRLGGALFTYTDRAAVTGLTPERGPTRGGTTVTVSGVNFAGSSTLLCRFGDFVTTAAVFVSTEVVSCVSPAVPADAAGRVYLELSDLGSAATWDDSSSSLADVSTRLVNLQEPGDDPALWTNSRVEFTFVEDSAVLAAYPSSGPSEGGTRISLTGFGFQDVPEIGCRFGGTHRPQNPADERYGAIINVEGLGGRTAVEVFEATAIDVPATFVSPTEVACIAPEQSLEWTDVREGSGVPSSSAGGAVVRVAVTLNGQDYCLRMAQYVYYPSPKVFSVSPDRGPSSGGTMVKVSGVNLTSAGGYPGFANGSLLCRFGGPGGEVVEASAVVGGSDDAVRCISPPDPQQGGGGTEVSVMVHAVAFKLIQVWWFVFF